MAKSKSKRVREKSFSPGPQTFDPEDFDLYELRHFVRSKIWPKSKYERMANVRKDIQYLKGHREAEEKLPPRSVILTIFSNILIPGLGNIYLKRSPFSISILFLSLLVMIFTFSPIFPFVQLVQSAGFAPPAPMNGSELTLFVPSSVQVGNQLIVGPTFSSLLVPLLLSWIHLLYLFVKLSHRIDWKL